MLKVAAAACAALACSAAYAADTMPAKPLFARLVGLHPSFQPHPTSTPSFTFSFTYQGRTYNDVFVGTPVSTNAATTVPIYIIPVQMKFATTSYSPLSTLSGGQTIVQNILASPVFQSSVDYVQGGTDLGTTQYIDAYQRGNLWGQVSSNTGYHLLLGSPTVTALQTITVPKSQGSIATEFGVRKTILANINYVDGKFQNLIQSLGIPNNAFPIFVTTHTYLTQNPHGGCCIGGYHSVNASNVPYAHFTYIASSGAFSQDVSALSHEAGEWADDPYVNNNSPCGILENGDPLEGEANYGDYAYTTSGFTYHLQDLAWLPYFGAPTSTSANGWFTFQGTRLSVCQNGS